VSAGSVDAPLVDAPFIEVTGLAGSALLQDSGRDLRSSGVPVSGAFDRFAHHAGTLLVGGCPADAAIEVAGWVEVRPSVEVTLAATGAVQLWVDGVAAPSWTSLQVRASQSVAARSPGTAYLAVAGGLLVDPVLGSRSTCLMGLLGPAPLAPGSRLPLADRPTSDTVGAYCRTGTASGPVRIVPGPHLPLTATSVTVVETSRMGVRVRPARPLRAAADLPSLGVLPGTIQVLPSGDWIVLGPDAGTMGGYPVVGVVVAADQGRWAQAAVGSTLDLVAVSPDMAPAVGEPVIVRVGQLPG
jgi:allophanate hydrolase subunit 2